MNCPKCGTINPLENKFCIGCGNQLTMHPNTENNQPQSVIQNQIYQQPIQNPQNNNQPQSVTQNQIYQQPIQNSQNNNQQSTQYTTQKNKSVMEYLSIILSVLIKPYTTLKEKITEFDNSKNSIFLAGIVTVIFTIASLIKTMLGVVIVKKYSFLNGTTTTWVWENLKELNYIQIIGKNLLIFAGMILAIAVLYYIASLIVKKQTNFVRLLGISAVAIVPMFLSILILSPLLSMIYAPLGMIISIVGIFYTFVILYEVTNQEIPLEGNSKYYFNVICFSILTFAAYYLIIKVVMSSISSNMNNIFNMFS